MNYIFTRPMRLQAYVSDKNGKQIKKVTVKPGNVYVKEYMFPEEVLAAFKAKGILVSEDAWKKSNNLNEKRKEASKKRNQDNTLKKAYKMIEDAGFQVKPKK